MARTIWSTGRPGLLVVVVGAAIALAACSGAASTAVPASAAAPASAPAPSPVVSPSPEASATSPAANTAASTKPGGDRYGSGARSSPSPAGASAGNAVTVVDFGFSPDTINVKAGTTVTWTNTGATHTVTADKGLFDSGPFKSGETFSFTFAKGGTFAYHCAIHSSMRGTITVTP